MTKIRTIFFALILLFSFSFLSAQVITKVVDKYVLIDKDAGVGKLNEKVKVYRIVGNDVISVGQVQILKFQNGKAAAKILKLNRGFQIQKGDFISMNKSKPPLAAQPYSGHSGSGEKSIKQVDMRSKTDRLGIHIGRFMPSSHFENIYVNSFSLGGYYKFVTLGNHSYFFEVDFPILKSPENEISDEKTSLLLCHLVDHIQMGGRIHFDLGGGVTYKTMKNEQTGMTESGTYFGFFLGFSVDFFSQLSMTFSPMIRYHTYSEASRWNEFVIAGLNISYSF